MPYVLLAALFEIDAATGIIRASQAFEKSGEFKLVVEIVDVDLSSNAVQDHHDRAGVTIEVLAGNFRKPEFMFPNKVNSTLKTFEVWASLAMNILSFQILYGIQMI